MRQSSFSKISELVIRWFNKLTTPADKTPEDGLIFWQDRVVGTILLTAAFLGFFAYVPSVLLCIKEKLWGVAVFDTTIYAGVIVLIIFREIPFSIRAYAIIFSSYLLGLVLLSVVGPAASGPVWMFVFPVLAGVILGFRASVTALAINIATLFIVGILIYMKLPGWLHPQPHTLERWVTISLNFILLNTMAALSLSMVLRGLQQSLDHEKSMRKSLEQNIADRQKKEKEEQRLREGLMRAQKMESIGILAGGIAHDFNNILSSIIGFAELSLDDTEKDSPMEDNLKEIYTAGLRAKELVKQILTVARRTDEALKPIRIRAIAEETAKLLRATVPTTIEMICNFDNDSLIMGNPTRVHQIFMNLCTNAVHAMEETGGRLTISLTDTIISNTSRDLRIHLEPGKYVIITVSDTGTGIAPELIDTIFEPYVTSKEPGEGTGLGLAVVHGIVKAYGGDISVDSRTGKGSVFSVYLPVIKGEITSMPDEPEKPATGTERVLIVDDESSVAGYAGQALQRLGYRVTVNTVSTQALAIFNSDPNAFDLIITDMTMPKMTGEQLADAAKKIRPDIPVILCTGYSKRIAGLGEKPDSVNVILTKPVSKTTLAQTVRNILDGERY